MSTGVQKELGCCHPYQPDTGRGTPQCHTPFPALAPHAPVPDAPVLLLAQLLPGPEAKRPLLAPAAQALVLLLARRLLPAPEADGGVPACCAERHAAVLQATATAAAGPCVTGTRLGALPGQALEARELPRQPAACAAHRPLQRTARRKQPALGQAPGLAGCGGGSCLRGEVLRIVVAPSLRGVQR
jgi:hypothetical protein